MALLEIIEEWDTGLRSGDPLAFPGYDEKLAGLANESVRTGRAEDAVVIEGDFSVLGGSMGVVHGEKVVRAIDRAIELGLPVLVESRSGGARMQEGMISLIQMARTAAAMSRLRDAGLGSVAVLHHPTTGGVFASYASLCDLVAAATGATVGFAGPRVAAAVTGRSVEGFSHTAETAFAAGLVDFVGGPDELATWVDGALGRRRVPLRIRVLPEPDEAPDSDNGSIGSPWDAVLAARRHGRPTGLDHAAVLVDSWTEIAGVDPTVRCGLATVGNDRVVVIAEDRYAGDGRPTPAGYALARRAIGLAGRRRIPLVTFIDTSGAEPGSDAEQAGIARQIAETFLALAAVPVPTIGVCVGEGGSGGAYAFGATDRFFIQDHAVFSVIGPEGAATILHRDPTRAAEVAARLRLTAADLVGFGIADAAVADDPGDVAAVVRDALAVAEVGTRVARLDAASRHWIRDTDVTDDRLG